MLIAIFSWHVNCYIYLHVEAFEYEKGEYKIHR